jgi:hypothetical protein
MKKRQLLLYFGFVAVFVLFLAGPDRREPGLLFPDSANQVKEMISGIAGTPPVAALAPPEASSQKGMAVFPILGGSPPNLKDDKAIVRDLKGVSRVREIKLSPELLNGELDKFSKGGKLEFEFFDDARFAGNIERAGRNVNGTAALSGKIDNEIYSSFATASTAGIFAAEFSIPRTGMDYAIYPRDGKYYVFEFRHLDRGAIENGDTKAPPPLPAGVAMNEAVSGKLPPAPANAAELTSPPTLGDPTSHTQIDVLIAYTASANSYATSNYGSMANAISLMMTKSQDCLTNSNINVTWNLVYSYQTGYTELNSIQDLYNFTFSASYDPWGYEGATKYMEEVHTYRTSYGADVCALLENISFTGGVGWLLNNVAGSKELAFHLTRIQQATLTSTDIHEAGHNMGAAHSRTQSVQKGPGLFSGYSAGWQWAVGSPPGGYSTGYCTVMTYEDFNNDGTDEYKRIDYFSDPALSPAAGGGIAIGTATDSNARGIREIKDVIAAYYSVASAGFNLSKTISSVAENGGTDTFTVVLTAPPASNVVFNVTSSAIGEATVAPSSLTFTPANWSSTQTVTITGVNDNKAGNDTATVTVSVLDASSDNNWDPLADKTVTVTCINDDTAGITISGISGNTTEAGGTATFTVRLTSQPTANVTIGLSSNDTSEGTVSPSSLLFTSGNWNVNQTVTVTGVDDAIADGNIVYTIVTAAASSTDPNYNGLNPADVSVTNNDNDVAGITVSGISGNTTEAGGTATFTVRLTSEPTANVSISLSSNDTSEGTVSPASLTFTSGNWNVNQTVAVTGVDDAIMDGNVAYNIVTAAASSADTSYNGLNPADVSVTNIDNDLPGFTIGGISGNTTEAGGTATFTVRLTSQPTANVAISLSSSDTSEGTVNPSSLLFTSANWNVNQTVTVTGVDDAIIDGNVAYSIVTAPATSSDPNYNSLNPSDIAAINNDNDIAGFTLSKAAATVPENAGIDTFTVVLTAQPASNVVLSVTSSATGEATVTPPTLTFNAGNWNIAQAVTITGVNDHALGNDTATILISVLDASSDYNWDPLPDKTVDVTCTNNDYTLISSTGLHGTVTPSETVESGTNKTFTMTPGAHYHVLDVLVDGVSIGAVASYEFQNVTSNHTVSVTYTIDTFALTASAGSHGTITPSATVDYGTNKTFNVTPDAHYHISDVAVDGASVGAVASYEFQNVAVNHTISASFAIDTHALKYLAVNGSISGNANQTVDYGADGSAVTAVPNPDRYFTSWNDGVKTLTRNDTGVTADVTYTANFRTNVFAEPSSIENLAGNAGNQKIFIISALSGQKHLTVELKNVSGDCDLYLKQGSAPTLQLYNYRSTNGPDMDESVSVLNPADGDWYVMVYAYGDYSGAILSVAYGTDRPDAPGNLAATNGTHADKIALTWDAVPGADNYEIFRSDVESIGLAAKINSAEVMASAYDNAFSVAGYYRYYYWVRAVDAFGNRGAFSEPAAYGATAEGSALLLASGTAKTAIAGSEGSVKTCKITVPTWQTLLEIRVSGGNGDCDFDVVQPLPGAETVRHSISGTSNDIVQIMNPIEGEWVIHLYGAKDYSGLSVTAKYSRVTAVPAAPAVSATDGTYEDKVVITWKAVAGVTSYEVFRNTVNSTVGAGFISIGEVSDLIYEDNTAVYGTSYYYFAKAMNSYYDSLSKTIKSGVSKFSAGNSGYLAKSPAAPGAVTASDGTYFDKIRVSWSKVAGATAYLVYRTGAASPAPNPATADPIGETGGLYIDDFGDDIIPQVGGIVKKYYYWIAAKNRNGTTVISKANDGYLSKKGPATITASNGTYSNRIVVTWTAVSGATAYDVYRYADSKFTQGETPIGTALTTIECADPVPPGITYYYRVKAKYGALYDSDFSLTVAAGKASGASNPTATALEDGVTSAKKYGAKGTSLYFSAEVPPGTARLVAILDGIPAPVGSVNDCDLFAKFANFPSNSSFNAKGVENKDNEILTVSNPAAGTWYFLLYGTMYYSNVTLTVNCYSVADIVLTQYPSNDLAVPFTATFKGKVLDESGAGLPNIVLQVRNPITGLTSSLAKTDATGMFTYSAPISTEGEHTFDFFFTEIPDNAKGTASHTVTTSKGCLETNNFFDFSGYLSATPVPVPLQADIVGLQTFLDIRNGWNDTGMVSPGDPYETLWINSTLVKAKDDARLLGKLDEGLYMFFYGVEGAGVGNDMSVNSALSALPLLVHVSSGDLSLNSLNSLNGSTSSTPSTFSTPSTVLSNLNSLGIIDNTQMDAVSNGGKIGVVAVAALCNPAEGVVDGDRNISLLAREQLEVLANIAAGTPAFIEPRKYSDVTAKVLTVTLPGGRTINVVVSAFVK